MRLQFRTFSRNVNRIRCVLFHLIVLLVECFTNLGCKCRNFDLRSGCACPLRNPAIRILRLSVHNFMKPAGLLRAYFLDGVFSRWFASLSAALSTKLSQADLGIALQVSRHIGRHLRLLLRAFLSIILLLYYLSFPLRMICIHSQHC